MRGFKGLVFTFGILMLGVGAGVDAAGITGIGGAALGTVGSFGTPLSPDITFASLRDIRRTGSLPSLRILHLVLHLILLSSLHDAGLLRILRLAFLLTGHS